MIKKAIKSTSCVKRGNISSSFPSKYIHNTAVDKSSVDQFAYASIPVHIINVRRKIIIKK